MAFTREYLVVTIRNLISTSEESREHSAGFVVYHEGRDRKRNYLLLRHRVGRHWGFPKGRVESGEDETAAALRETCEETGIKRIERIPEFRVVSCYQFLRNNKPTRKDVVYFLGHVEKKCNPHLSAEHTEGRWLSCTNALQLLTYSDAHAVLRKAEELITSNYHSP